MAAVRDPRGRRLAKDQSHAQGCYVTPESDPDVRTGAPKSYQHRPVKVILDPDSAGGGQVVDLTKMTQRNVRLAMQKGYRAADLLLLFSDRPEYARSDVAHVPYVASIPREPPPGTGPDEYVVPASDSNGTQYPSSLVTPATPVASPVQMRKLSTEAFFNELDEKTPIPPSPPEEMETEARAPSVSTRDSLQARARQEGEVVRQQAFAQIVQDFLQTLRIPFLAEEGGRPTKPKRTAIFHIEGFGMTAHRFHEIVHNGRVLALVYDTRYDEGVQFLPATEKPFRIVVPHLGKDFEDVSSADLKFSIGVLDIVILLTMSEPKPVAQAETI